MSYVGAPFEYDLFVSYSHATSTGDDTHYDGDQRQRDWSRQVVKALTGSLRIGLSDVESEDRRFRHFLDAREMTAGAQIRREAKDAVEKSALILILMSPAYRDSDWCRAEVEWFFEQAARDGRGHDQCVLRVVVPTRNEPPNKRWPPQLLDVDGSTVHRGDPFFDDSTGTPIEIERYKTGEFDRLGAPIRCLVGEIKTKLDALKGQLEAVRRIAPPVPASPVVEGAAAGPPPCAPDDGAAAMTLRSQLYLQRHRDEAAWEKVRDALGGIALVNPWEMEESPDNLSLLQTYRARRQTALVNCQGLVLLRTSADDPTDLQAAEGYDDRRVLLTRASCQLPWVLIDAVGDAGPRIPLGYDLPRVSMTADDWPAQALSALKLG